MGGEAGVSQGKIMSGFVQPGKEFGFYSECSSKPLNVFE